MGFSNQGMASHTPSSGRAFAAVDPERQREIDLEHARKIARRETPFAQQRIRTATAAWLATMRDPSDEGGSVRRSR